MQTGFWIVCVSSFVVANAWSGLLFKFAAESAGRRMVWWYILGNVIGALGPLALTLALKRANPNLTYAICYGGAFAVLQILAWHLFRESLSSTQWAGVACVGFGILLLQLGHR